MRYLSKHIILPLSLLFLACDNTTVPQAEYDALVAEKQDLQAENDSLQFELSSLKMYVDYLEEENGELVEELKRTPVERR
ncbi:MAG: hypothetical protein J6O49_15580 [Bacteroidaceae bacterium]|nr:hypothetical protein [Bacteroidaceae bacterium]MBP3843164.1 hypothetical protein [Prevotella sp.]